MPHIFEGHIPETNIIVDKCNTKHVGCYFLITHPHTDHTQGLTENFNKGAIHCSKLCKELLLMRFPLIQQHNPIIGHSVGSTFTLSHLQSPERRGLKRKKRVHNSNDTDIDIDSEDEWRDMQSNGVQITLIDANHCPGSVMFLIKNCNGKVYLHTGDYRTCSEMLCNELLTNVWIDICYMDVTFCHPSFRFPTKKEIALQTTEYIQNRKKDRKWMKKHNISFKFIYIEAKQLGVEPFLVEMCKGFNTKIWANSRSWQYKNLNHFERTKEYLTLDQSEAMFHIPFIRREDKFADFVAKDRKMRQANNLCSVMYISPTTMYFALTNLVNTPIKIDKNGITHVLYSMHSDYNEMKQLVSKLNVKKVIPFCEIAIPFGKKWDNFNAIHYVSKQFEDCIQSNVTESKDFFIPNLNTCSDSMDLDINCNQNENILSCVPTALNKQAQNEKFLRIRNMIKQNKQRSSQYVDCKSPPKRMNTAPPKRMNTAPPKRISPRRGGKKQDEWINSMKQIAIKDVSISDDYNCTTPILPKRNRKRKRSELTNNKNENASKKRKIQEIAASSSQSDPSPILSLSCERKGILDKYELSDNTFEEEEEDDGDAKMEILIEDNCNDITPGNDDSTINESEIATQTETQTDGINNDKITHSAYRTFEDGIRRPFYLSQWRVQNRNFIIYGEEEWNKNNLNIFLNDINILKMKRVYSIRNAKFIVIDSEMMDNKETEDDILYKLGYEYFNGCHSIREVWSYEIFEYIKVCNFMRGTLSKEFEDLDCGACEDYFILSTHNVRNVNYLKSKKLWPLKPKINEHPTR